MKKQICNIATRSTLDKNLIIQKLFFIVCDKVFKFEDCNPGIKAQIDCHLRTSKINVVGPGGGPEIAYSLTATIIY